MCNECIKKSVCRFYAELGDFVGCVEFSRGVTFKVIDKRTGKEPTDRVIYNIAKKGNLMTMDIDQFFIGEDGSLVLADDCGNITYCDTKRFKVVAESEE